MSNLTRRRQVVLSASAREDIVEILLWSSNNFGAAAARRYRALINQALRDLASDGFRPGSEAVQPTSPNIRTWHIALSRSRAEATVKSPRHLILYRVLSTTLNIGRILHDSRDLPRHLPTDFKD